MQERQTSPELSTLKLGRKTIGLSICKMEHFAAILGTGALVVGVASYAVSRDLILRVMGILCCTLWGLHFGLLGDLYGASMMLVAITMTGAAILSWMRLARAALAVNAAAAGVLAVGAISGQGNWRPLLPVFGGMAINSAMTFLGGHAMTAMIVVGELLWFANAWMIGSTSAMISGGFNLAALAVRTYGVARRQAKAYPVIHPAS